MKNIDLIGKVDKGTWNKIYEDELVQVCDGTAILGTAKLQSYMITIKKFDISLTMHKTAGRNALPEELDGRGERIRSWAFKHIFRAAVVDQIDCAGLINHLEEMIANA